MDPGNIASLTGWGATTGNPPFNSTSNLRRVQMPIISNTNANNLNWVTNPSTPSLTANMIAYYQSGSGVAPGDSGGPATITVNGKPILMGASSWGLTPKDQKPTIYTKIKNYADWVKNNTGVSFFNSEIQGPSNFCGSQSYSIGNLPAGTTVTWSASPSGIVSLSPSGSSVTLTKISNGTVTLTANLST